MRIGSRCAAVDHRRGRSQLEGKTRCRYSANEKGGACSPFSGACRISVDPIAFAKAYCALEVSTGTTCGPSSYIETRTKPLLGKKG